MKHELEDLISAQGLYLFDRPMKHEDAIETYYFVKSKKKQIKELIKDYPMLFTEEKKIPLNFQMKMNELSENTSARRHSEKKFRLSMQSRIDKIGIRRNIMKLVLRNRETNHVFKFLNPEESNETPSWYYVDGDENELKGPLTNSQMQMLFEDEELKPLTIVKKKLMPEFVQMRYLLNKFCRLQAISSINEGNYYDHLNKNSPRKGGDKENKELEEWLAVVGKKIDVDPHIHENAAGGGIRPSTMSMNFSRKERMSFVISKQSMADFKSNPGQSNLFDKVETKKGAEAEHVNRKSFNNAGTSQGTAQPSSQQASGFGKKRPRHATEKHKK